MNLGKISKNALCFIGLDFYTDYVLWVGKIILHYFQIIIIALFKSIISVNKSGKNYYSNIVLYENIY